MAKLMFHIKEITRTRTKSVEKDTSVESKDNVKGNS